MQSLAISKFSIPGEAQFPLNAMYSKPANRGEEGLYILCAMRRRFVHSMCYEKKVCTFALVQQTTGCDHHRKIFSKSCGLPRSLATVPSLLQDPLHGTASQIM